MESRSRASPEQFAAILEFMERHRDLVIPRLGAQGRIKSDRLWQELTELLNSIGGGVIKSTDKWKKVWADWKTKTKKKGLAMRREASGTGGGPSSRHTLTAMEERVLGIMGLSAVVGQAEVEEIGLDNPPSERISLPQQTQDSVINYSQATDAIQSNVMLDITPTFSLEGTAVSTVPPLPPVPRELTRHGVVEHAPPLQPTPPGALAPAPISLATSPTASTLQEVPFQRRQRATNQSPAPSTTASTPRRRRLLRARRRVLTPFGRATSEFAAIELRRLQLDEVREKNTHEREIERLRLESLRIEMEEKRNHILNRLAIIVDNLTSLLPVLRPSSLPSTDILSSGS